MSAQPPILRPLPLVDLPPELAGALPELADLARLGTAGLPLGRVIVVPAGAEERFYRLNNLPARLLQVFAAVDLEDPDEDDVEEAAPEAQALVRENYFLDEFIDDVYEATAGLGVRLRVRRPGELGRVAPSGRPVLMALKHLYQDDWSYEAVWRRLQHDASVALDPRPVLVHDGNDEPAPQELEARATGLLGGAVRLRCTADGAIVVAQRG